ncbi:poly-beta-1,6-N-acetyl-D-glucosamine N-deacetylase PgaB [Chromobacterium violaceum]|uniref:poly-beta-1,6-N-acetyl-D-glucosamine N-deacetylase PgaB n=1 Tax=Chromobacterium violaceum TaxID=536 RepID=UPI0035A6743A
MSGFRMVWLLLALGCGWIGQAQAQGLLILCYHEISQAQARQDDESVDVDALARQLEWLRGAGFRFVSLDDAMAASAGGPALPDKSVLLSFDDGYRSVYTQVYPVLKAFRAPALIGLVGSWLSPPEGGSVNFAGVKVPRDDFLSWGQIREMQASGLVEVANHTFDLHYGIQANPQGNLLPAASSARYDPASGSYESHGQFLARVERDLARNSALLRQKLGRAPRAMVWPYGSYTREAGAIAAKLGMPAMLTLDDGVNGPDVPLSALRRVLVGADMSLADFARLVQASQRWPQGIAPRPERAMPLSLDDIYDPDPAKQEEKLGKALDRVKEMGASIVYLKAFHDQDGDGVARQLYFPNSHLPMRADLFNRAAWQLDSRVGVEVYAWLPVDGLRLPPPALFDVYRELGRAGRFRGLLFRGEGLPPAGAPAMGGRDALQLRLAEAVRESNPRLKAASGLDGDALLSGAADDDWRRMLAEYDRVEVSATPRQAAGGNADDWLRRLQRKVAETPGALEKTVFELPSVDPRSGKPVPAETLAGWMRELNGWGVRQMAYYPGLPDSDAAGWRTLRRAFSLAETPR